MSDKTNGATSPLRIVPAESPRPIKLMGDDHKLRVLFPDGTLIKREHPVALAPLVWTSLYKFYDHSNHRREVRDITVKIFQGVCVLLFALLLSSPSLGQILL